MRKAASFASVTAHLRALQQERLPPAELVWPEAFVNYFPYDYPKPGPGEAFAVETELAGSSIQADYALLRVALQARDVRIRVEFDPGRVSAYRLLGYDQQPGAEVVAGEVGSGEQITALYELRLAPGAEGTLVTVDLRHRDPAPDSSVVELRYPGPDRWNASLTDASPDLQIAAIAGDFAEELAREQTDRGYYRHMAENARYFQRSYHPEDQELVDAIEAVERIVSQLAAFYANP